jgi:hypothetical protein
MSQMGQKRRFKRRPITSGLPPTPDILGARQHVSKVPEPEVAVVTGTPSARNNSDVGTSMPNRFGSLEIEHH